MALPVEYILLDLRAALGRNALVALVAPPGEAWVAGGRIILLGVRKGTGFNARANDRVWDKTVISVGIAERLLAPGADSRAHALAASFDGQY